MKRCHFTSFVFLLIFGLSAPSVQAESIRLQSGAKISGKIISHDEEGVRVSRQSGVITVPYRLIRRIEDGGDSQYSNLDGLMEAWKKVRGPAEKAPKKYIKRAKRKANSESRTPSVELYMTQWCHYCRKMEAFLTKNRIKYRRYNIEYDKAAHRRYKQMGGKGVPLTKVGTYVIKGYDPSAVMRALR